MGDQKPSPRFRKRGNGFSVNTEDLAEKVLGGDRLALSKAITLIESENPLHSLSAQTLLGRLLPFTGRAMRIGITGMPGAGKSTFIEALGVELCRLGKKVAVLAIDPSSSVSGGSLLGDKTRMERLSREIQAYIRPSPAGTTLGGVHRKTREAMLLCEAAGFDVILIETVGVGQNEVVVRTMVDMFVLLTITGAGDELQAMKKGIVELADLIIVTKADGDNREKAITTKNELERLLPYLKPATPEWNTRVTICSAFTGEGIPEIWETILSFFRHGEKQGFLAERRKKQRMDWLMEALWDELKRSFFQNDRVKVLLSGIMKEVAEGKLPVRLAVEQLMEAYRSPP
jgi:methylmalonyl-CoA mutase metallochaperone MeaB